MSRKSPQVYNRHHIINRCRGGTNHPDNLKTMLITRHRALHILHQNESPHEQLISSLTLNATALRDEYREDIMRVIQNYDEDCYKPHVRKPGVIRR